MEEEDPESKPERPRYLLPDGCKDLYDLIHWRDRQRREMSAMPNPPAPAPAKPAVPAAHSPPEFPPVVSLPDLVTVRDLAGALGIKVFVIIKTLMEMDIFANPGVGLDFATASRVCSRYGVPAVRAP